VLQANAGTWSETILPKISEQFQEITPNASDIKHFRTAGEVFQKTDCLFFIFSLVPQNLSSKRK
jgi:hypothetical protein